jgi:thioesterase domain-containing protein
MVEKILAAQADGPYTIGGVCIGGLLAYEVAAQLRASGREVSLLVLLDAPCQPYLSTYKSLSTKLRHPLFFMQKIVHLHPRRYFAHLGRRLVKRLRVSTSAASTETAQDMAQEMIENAAISYYPARYDGEVLLLLPEHSPPRLNFLPGWQSVVPQSLDARHVDGPHRNFITLGNVRAIAEAIESRLPRPSPAPAKAPLSEESMLDEAAALP